MSEVVVDASFLAKLAIHEADSTEVRDWFASEAKGRFVGPDLLFHETGRALQKAGLGRSEHQTLLSGIVLYASNPGIWEQAADLTFYDAAYVQLAKERDASLATTDNRMRLAAKQAGIPLAFRPS